MKNSINNMKRDVLRSPFVMNVGITFLARIVALFFGISTYILIARLLGPEGKGVFTLVILLPTFIVMFTNLGVGPATVFYTAKQRYSYREILGSNTLLALLAGMFGIVCGLVVIFYFRQVFFKGVKRNYLLFSLAIIPANLFYIYFQNIILGMQRMKVYNIVDILRVTSLLSFILVTVWFFKWGVNGAILSWLLAWVLLDIILFFYLLKMANGISLKLNGSYIKNAFKYGIQAHFGNILGFLNYRIDMFLVNGFLNSMAVGFYSVAVELAERLWLLSQAAGLVLFPKVAAETGKDKHVDITPLVTRTVFFLTLIGGIIFAAVSRWIVLFLYSPAYLPAVIPLLLLIPGVIFFSIARVMANDLAGKNRVLFNVYAVGLTVLVNVILNVSWIPCFGIRGAAFASTVSYVFNMLFTMIFYCHFSGNSWKTLIFPQEGDFHLYRQIVGKILRM